MVKTSLLLLAILASANGELNEVPACAYTGISTSCQDYISAGFGMVNWNSNNQNFLDEGICAAYDDGLCAQECTPQEMDGCSSTGSTGAICFTGDSLLTLADGTTTKKFHDLEIGDVILGADRNGTISPSPVLFLPHPENDIVRSFDEIEMVNGMIVRMTRNHLLPLCDGALVTARSLKEGDCVMTKDGEGKVAKTTKDIEAGGIYTAVTENEFLVVDGVVASPFALAHGLVNAYYNLHRAVYKHFPSLMKVPAVVSANSLLAAGAVFAMNAVTASEK